MDLRPNDAAMAAAVASRNGAAGPSQYAELHKQVEDIKLVM